MSESEAWATVRGYESVYAVSSLGRVMRVAGGRGTTPGKILAPRVTRDGYIKAFLRDTGRDQEFFVHRLVFEAFRRPLLDGEQIDHLDGNPANNRLDNLDAVTRLENMQRSFAKGRESARGEAQGRARFTAEQVVAIRQRVAAGERQNAIAAEFGVTPTAINCIVKRLTWAHLP